MFDKSVLFMICWY